MNKSSRNWLLAAGVVMVLSQGGRLVYREREQARRHEAINQALEQQLRQPTPRPFADDFRSVCRPWASEEACECALQGVPKLAPDRQDTLLREVAQEVATAWFRAAAAPAAGGPLAELLRACGSAEPARAAGGPG
jgi:hypothetical protein